VGASSPSTGDESGGEAAEELVVLEHRVLAASDPDEGHPRARGPREVIREGRRALGTRDAITVAMNEEEALAAQTAVPGHVARVHPGGESDRGHHLRVGGSQDRGAPAQGMAHEARGEPRSEAGTDLAKRPARVVHRRVVGVPAAMGVEKPKHHQPALRRPRDPPSDRDHAQDRELRRANAHALAPRRAAVQHENRAPGIGGDRDVDQARADFHELSPTREGREDPAARGCRPTGNSITSLNRRRSVFARARYAAGRHLTSHGSAYHARQKRVPSMLGARIASLWG
jgi:hypothetical protein